jgi:hypothetical protein
MFFEFLESHSYVLYPALAVGVLVLMLMGFVVAWRRDDLDIDTRIKYKREIVNQLRRKLAGMTSDDIADLLNAQPRKLLPLLTEMQEEGTLATRTRKDQSFWVLKGVGT